MKGIIRNLSVSGKRCLLYLPEGYSTNETYYPVIYVNGEDNIEEIVSGIEPSFDTGCRAFMLLSIESEDWGNDFTPWPALPLSKKGESFRGGALKYLEFITSIAKPYIDVHYRTKPEPGNTGLIGYSLGGLTALYALYTSSAFGKIGSLSGSLWYDGWTEFMDSNIPANTDVKVYLSLGKMEEHSRNQRMAAVGDCTRKASDILAEQLISKENIVLEWNDGGHFAEIPQRFIRALLWLMQ